MTNEYLTAQKSVSVDPADTSRMGEFDGLGRYPIYIDSPHHEIHEGYSFTYSDFNTGVASGTSVDYMIVTPNTDRWSHFFPSIYGSLEYEIYIYEEPTTSANGTAGAVYNRNRNSATTNTSLVYKGPTVTGTGTQIFTNRIASGINGGGQSRAESEIVLKQNTKYLVRATSRAASNVLSVAFNWYEHSSAD